MNNEKITSCEIMHSCAKIFKLYSFHVKYFWILTDVRFSKTFFSMQVSYPYDCSVFLREKSRALPNNVALSFIESINTFTGTFKMAHLY